MTKITPKLKKWPKYLWNLKNNQNPPLKLKNDQKTPLNLKNDYITPKT